MDIKATILKSFILAVGLIYCVGTTQTIAQVKVSVTVSKSLDTLVYKYVPQNLPTSTGVIDEFGVTYNAAIFYGNLPARSISPGGWAGATMDVAPIFYWWAQDSVNYIPVNSSLSGFTLKSLGIPSIVNSYSWFSSDSDCCEGDETAPVSIFVDAMVNKTISPNNPPIPFDSLKFLDTLKSYTSQSFSLLWIGNQATANKYTAFFDSAKTQLGRNDLRSARASLDSTTANAVRDSGSSLTSEAFALIFYNTKFLLGKLPIPIPQYTLTLSIVGSGTVSRNPDRTVYDSATTVQLTANPSSSNYRFVGWSGSLTGTTNPVNLTMNSNKTVTATFIRTFQVTVGTSPVGLIDTVDGSASTATQTLTWDSASTHTIATKTPQSGGTGTQYVWLNWNDGNTSLSRSVTVAASATYAANFKKQYQDTVKTSPTGRSFTIDGTSYTTQQIIWWDTGSSHTLVATSPESIAVGTQYLFTSWSDGGAQNHTVTATTTKSFKASFTKQYRLTINSSPANSGTTNLGIGPSFRDSGSVVSIAATPGPGYHFVQWTDSATGTANPVNVTMNKPKIVTANFAVNPVITATALGGGTISPSGNISINYGATQRFTFSPLASYRFDTLLVDGVKIDSTSGYTFTNVTSNHTISVKFIRTFQVTVGTSPVGLIDTVDGSASTATQTLTWDSASTHTIATKTPQSGGTGTQYVWLNWNDGNTSLSRSVTVAASATYAANFKKQYQDTVKTSPTGRSFTIDGTSYTTQQIIWWDTGSSHTLVATSPESIAVGTQYLFTSWSDGGAQNHTVTATTTKSFKASFTKQYRLTINSSPANSGTTNLGIGPSFRDSGSVVSIAATPGPGYHFVQWTDSATGTANPVNVTMNKPKIVTANFALNPSVILTNTLNDGWNMLSVPDVVSDLRKSVVYPNAISNAFTYISSYIIKDTLSNGVGYWLKFNPGPPPVSYTGPRIDSMRISVMTGWNMIGSVSRDIPIGAVRVESTSTASNYFGYGPGGYSLADTIKTGKAYWIKLNQNGKLMLGIAPTTYSQTTMIQPPPAPDVPATPTLSSPANGSTGVSTGPTLAWNPADSATSYRLQVSTVSDFSTVVYDQAGITATAQAVGGLSYSTLYYWRVSAYNSRGYSNWSAVWHFTTQAPPPPPCSCCIQSVTTLDQFTVSDALGNQQAMFVNNAGKQIEFGNSNFELPPEAMAGIFQARFQSNKLIESVQPGKGMTPIPIVVKNVSTPVTLSWTVHPENKTTYWIKEPGSGRLRQILANKGSMVLSGLGNGVILLQAQSTQPCP